MSGTNDETSTERDGVWIAYYHDWSAFAVFRDELSCLRQAVDRTMAVGFVSYGEDLGGGMYPK